MIRLRDLTKSYGSIIAVDHLNLEVKAGELFGFLGPNGAGKTTTIKMLVGALKPTSGSIFVNGIDMKTNPLGIKKILGYVPDSPFIYGKLTGREFLRFVTGLHRMKRQEAARTIELYLDLFELSSWADALIESYSHGMKQKLVMAAAVTTSPRLLVIDEPMVGLDPKSALTAKFILRKLASQGVTIFLSTHTLSIAEQLCDRIGIIQAGKLSNIGTLDELRQAAANDQPHLEEIFLSLTGEPDSDKIVAAFDQGDYGNVAQI